MGLFSRNKTPERLEAVQQELTKEEVKRITSGRVGELDMGITPRSLAAGIFNHFDSIIGENHTEIGLNAMQTYLQANLMHTGLRLDLIEEYVRKRADFDHRTSRDDVWDTYQWVIRKIPEEERRPTAMGTAVSAVSAASLLGIMTPEFAERLRAEGTRQGIMGFTPEMVEGYMKRIRRNGLLGFGKGYAAAENYAIRLSSELQRQYILPGMINLGVVADAEGYREMERYGMALLKAKGIDMARMDREVSFIGKTPVYMEGGRPVPIAADQQIEDSIHMLVKASDIALRKMGFEEGFAGFDTGNLSDVKKLTTFLRIRDREAERIRREGAGGRPE